jgi:hypothetical protein
VPQIPDRSRVFLTEKERWSPRELDVTITGQGRVLKRSFPSAASIAFVQNWFAETFGLLWDEVSVSQDVNLRLFELE